MHALTPMPDRPSRRGESGFIMVVTVLTMVIVFGLIAAVSTSAIHLSSTGRRTDYSAQALAAAQAGAQVALFRLNQTGGATGATGAMGNGATYSYTISSLSSSSSPCTGLWVQNSSESVGQDCIASTGTQNGVSEEVETRVAGYNATPLFSINGLFAISGFTAADTVSGTFSLGSNGSVSFTNSASGIVGDVEYYGSLSETNNTCSGTCVPEKITSQVSVPSVPATAWSAAKTSNNDSAISWNSGSNCNSCFTINSSQYTVTSNGANSQTINVPAGTYYYCNLNLGNGTTLNTTSWPVKIYIDSSYDSGACSGVSSNGAITGSNGFSIANTSGTASNVQVYLYGEPGCTTSGCPNDFSPNSQSMTADVWAPYSSADPGGAFTMTGDMVVGYLTAQNSLTFNYQSNTLTTGSSSSTAYYPTADGTCDKASTSC
jgi:hypothetical protein